MLGEVVEGLCRQVTESLDLAIGQWEPAPGLLGPWDVCPTHHSHAKVLSRD